MRRAVVLGVVAVAFAVIGSASFEAGRILEAGSVLGSADGDATWWLLGSFLAGAAAVGVAAWLPLRLEGKAVAAVGTMVGCAATLVVGLDRGYAADVCDRFEIDRAAFQASVRGGDSSRSVSAAKRVANGVEHCGTLRGRTRAEVARTLGPPQRRDRREWRWSIGVVNDYLGPGDSADLVVRFGRDGRVVRIE